ncbi:Gx transporter family protein [Anaerorhabdus furcosa]|uniref:Heptaprenyl diphosphate synthase n=1 Tax=Anaerorhabdus furcosa TaxID=118967 RepID=A0A1T4PWK9_9FIRM|nr:Gx transporter family protein [Anaerorhabdus furcosa]SJZ95923.1 heptaprenyl diphosphate synthase [Anaerorhabdus furcosa]
MKTNSTKRFVYITLLSAMAITINILESTLIPPLPFGIRFGLANIIALITIEILGVKEMIIVNIMRVVIGNLLRGLIFGTTFWIAFGGVALSSIVLILCKKMNSSLLFTSTLSSIGHTVGQVFVVMFIYQQASMIAIVPYLLIAAIPTGILTGIVAKEALKRVKV